MSDAGDSFISLSTPYLSGNEQRYVADCLETGWLSGAGEYVTKFEAAICEFVGVEHAVACASGTAALHLSLLLSGVGPGDAVIVPTVTFIASANAVRYCGAEPVLVGCDDRLGLDVEAVAAYLESAWSANAGVVVDPTSGRPVKAIMPVHIFGDPCDMVGLMTLAEKYGLPVIEDATESLGSRYVSGPFAGKSTGSIGRVNAFSFNANKIITTGGGGMLVTDDAALADRARYLIHQAKDDAIRYVHGAVGFNYALGNVPAAIGVAQMENLPAYIEVKKRNRALYADMLNDVPGLRIMERPEGTDPNCWFVSLLVEPDEFGMDREALMQHLAAQRIQSRPLWLPIHMQKPYAECTALSVERAVWYWERILNLPCSSNLTSDEVGRVCSAIRSITRS